MSSSLNEDQDSRKTTGMEESNDMTIEFLRARLSSERSVSKSARQRADELAKRVAELEEELQFVSQQRKKAEKATVDVLAILENRGISDVSEEFNSNSDKDESLHDFKSSNGSLMIKETSTNAKPRNNDGEAYSSSEIESSPSTGRSLAWKSTKDSQHSLEKKKYMESVRRRANFASGSSSARRVGKSCRRIRRRETRSMEELQNDGTEEGSHSLGASNCSDGEPAASREGYGYDNGKDAEGSHGETQKSNGHYYSGQERDEDMESALQHQAQLIGRYEEEEKAQREWEEKFRENNNCTQESYDPGNHSDVTEERYEIDAPKLSHNAGTLNSNNQETKHETVDARFSEEPQPSKNSLALINAGDKGDLQDEKGNGCPESSASDFSFPLTKEKWDHKFLEASELRHQPNLPNSVTMKHPSPNISSQAGPSAIPGISSSLDFAVVPRDTSNNLESVLEALQLAKLSLNQKIHNSPPWTGESSVNAIKPSNPDTLIADSFKVPVFSPGLFRLPTDAQFEATTLPNSGVGTQNFIPQIAPSRFLSEPLVAPRSSSPSNLFHTAPNRSFTPEIQSGAPPQRSFSQPRLSEGASSFSRPNHLDPYNSPAYPYLPDITFRLPLNEEGTSQTFPSSETGLPPVTRLSSYFDRFRPNMHYR